MTTVTSSDGTTIAYSRVGAGPAIIYVSPAFSYRAFDPAMGKIASQLAPHFTVYTYDRRGRGESGDTASYAVEREIDDIAALIAEAGGAAGVYGHSSGAVLALDAAGHGLAITRLALYEPPFIVDDSRPSFPADFVARLDALVAAGQMGDAAAYFMTQGPGVPAEVVAQMRGDPSWAMFEALAPTLRYDAAITAPTMVGAPLPTERWATVTIPTLVMDGGASPAYMRNGVAALGRVLPNATYRTLEGQDHGVAPEAIAPILAAFFAE